MVPGVITITSPRLEVKDCHRRAERVSCQDFLRTNARLRSKYGSGLRVRLTSSELALTKILFFGRASATAAEAAACSTVLDIFDVVQLRFSVNAAGLGDFGLFSVNDGLIMRSGFSGFTNGTDGLGRPRLSGFTDDPQRLNRD